MAYRELFVFVEGDSDRRFFREVLEHPLKGAGPWDAVTPVPYAQRGTQKVRALVYSIRGMNDTPHTHADYVFLADLNDAPCVTLRKQKLAEHYADIDPERIIVVRPEIEAWLLAGLDADACETLGIDELDCTDELTKEDFEECMPDSYDSRIDFQTEICRNYYNLCVAKQKNSSIAYFADKYLSLEDDD